MDNQTLAQVRLRVDARIAAHRERLEAREQRRNLRAESMECCCLCAPSIVEAMSPPPMLERARKLRRAILPPDLPVPSATPRPPNLNAANLSFAARVVIAVRDRFGGDAPKVYTAAKLTRQVYSQIVSDETRKVSKRTAVRFAFALHLTKEEATALLKSAGYAFSNSLTEDYILQACLEVDPPVWNLDDVNLVLREYRVDFQF